MDWYDPKYYYNIVRDWNKAQGYTNPADAITVIPRDINIRYISLENSSPAPVAIAITIYGCLAPVPKARFLIQGGEIKHLGVNTQGGPTQYIWMLDPKTGKVVGQTKPINTNANEFVLRQGINEWFVQTFRRSRVWTASH